MTNYLNWKKYTNTSPACAAVQPSPGSGAGAADSGSGANRTRAECLLRYREKKARRVHHKKIRWVRYPPPFYPATAPSRCTTLVLLIV